MFQFPEAEFDIARADEGCVVARLFEHLMGHVDADHLAGVTDLPRGEKTIESGTTTEIDDDLARLHRSNCLRVAAAKAEIGALGNRRQLRLRITHPSRLVVRGGLGTATRRGCRCATACLACLCRDTAIARARTISLIAASSIVVSPFRRPWSSARRYCSRRPDRKPGHK